MRLGIVVMPSVHALAAKVLIEEARIAAVGLEIEEVHLVDANHVLSVTPGMLVPRPDLWLVNPGRHKPSDSRWYQRFGGKHGRAPRF